MGAWGKLYQDELKKVSKAVTSGQALVYVALVTFRNGRTGVTVPVSAASVSAVCGLTRRHVIRAIDELVNVGLIVKEPTGTTKPPRYSFPLAADSASDTGDTS